MHSAIFRISFISSDLFSTKTVELTLEDAGVLSSQTRISKLHDVVRGDKQIFSY